MGEQPVNTGLTAKIYLDDVEAAHQASGLHADDGDMEVAATFREVIDLCSSAANNPHL